MVGVLAREDCAIRRVVETDVFVPLATRHALTGESLALRTARQFFLLGRLAPGVSLQQAQARMEVAAAALHRRDPAAWTTRRGTPGTITVISESAARVPPQARLGVIAFLAFLQGMMVIVLLIVCSNLANLAMGRALEREHEVAVRLALGASHWQVVAQLLCESLLLALAGGAAGLLLTRLAVHWMAGVDLHLGVTFLVDLRLDYRVLLFAVLLTAATTLLFGMAPALYAARTEIAAVLGNGADPSAAGGGGSLRLRRALIVAEVAMSCILLVPAGLFLRSLHNVARLDLGFDAAHLALLSVSLDPGRYGPAAGAAAYDRMLAALRSAPGVASADLAASVPLSGAVDAHSYREAGPDSNREARQVLFNLVGSDYFNTLRIPLLRGRPFLASDGPASHPVAIVNQAFAHAFFPHQDALGKLIVEADAAVSDLRRGTAPAPIEIVGIVGTGKVESIHEPPTPYLYRPIRQEYSPAAILQVRTQDDPARRLSALAAAVQAVDAGVPIFDVKTMDRQLALTVGPYDALATLLAFLGAAGLGLSCIGLFGLVVLATARRRREVAIRMALGAARGDIVRLLAGQGCRLAVLGVSCGMPAAAGVALLVSSILFGVDVADPATYLAVAALLLAVAAAASIIPAWRAAAASPGAALRRP